MSRVAPLVPEESDLLCEGCGYTLNGLPQSSNCPECGKPIEQSLGENRVPSQWEESRHKLIGFFITTATVITRPTEFFRTLQTRNTRYEALIFGVIHWFLASNFFAAAWLLHIESLSGGRRDFRHSFLAIIPIFAIYCSLGLAGLTWVAAKLSAWEAGYRGMRLPLSVVLRGMYYHAAHYLPVAFAAVAIVIGYRTLLTFDIVTREFDMAYLYVLCGTIVVSAVYLFWTYWIAMRNMMYANR